MSPAAIKRKLSKDIELKTLLLQKSELQLIAKYKFHPGCKLRISAIKGMVKVLTYNLGHNILEHYNVLVEIRWTKSKTKRGI